MRKSIDEPVSVVCYYNARTRHMQPYMINWNNHEYYLGKIDFRHKTWVGKHQVHHFSIADKAGKAYFKLALRTDSLQWTIEEYMYADMSAPVYASPDSS